VIVEVTENDLKLPQQQHKEGSLSDLALYQLLQKLSQYKPRVIGLDIYRDFAVKPELKKLATELQQNQRLIAICKSSDQSINDPGVASPPEIPNEQLGFSDFITDPDGVLRRYLLVTGVEPTSLCITNYAFSIQVAFRYLAAEGILPKYTLDGNLQFNDVVLERFSPRSGGYQKTDVLGYQVMLNYRSPGEPENIAPKVTLAQILNGRVNVNAFKDKVVLVGTTANSYGDYWLTPYSSREEFGRRSSGVIAQAQMTSQILSAVLDKRPLLWATPFWVDIFWILGWSLVGGVLAIQLKSPISLWLAIALGEICLCALSFALLLHSGYWVPLLPSGLALLATSGSVATCTNFATKKQQRSKFNELD
jgi:CHASE2 domain-containing sensor protein